MQSSVGRKMLRVLVLALVPAARVAAQSEVLYLTNGDASTLQAFQGGNLVFQSTTHHLGYPLAVRDTIWIGHRDNGPQAIEYDLNGVPTGNTATLAGINPNFLDGAVNGDVNYVLDASGNRTVYQADADWRNLVPLFDPGTSSNLGGITYDQVSGNVFVTDSSTVYEFTLTGVMVASFGHGAGTNSIAYEASTDTLWLVPNGASSPLLQYSKSGALLQTVSTPVRSSNIWGAEFQASFGVRYCSPALPNSSGAPASISVTGSAAVADNDLTLTAEGLPVGEFGYFLVGSNQGQVMPPGSQGIICLACGFHGCAGIGRYNQPGSIIVGPVGSISPDLTALPLSPPQAVMPGETWNFQCWFRDLGSNNFTDAIAVTFR
ncbi:MAG: hypothetical protein GY711_07445 [bacterium]|nr:hypothetical protein [bacterium]